MRWSRSRSRLRTSNRLRLSTGTRRRTRGFRGALRRGLQEDPGRPVVLELVMALAGTLGTVGELQVDFDGVPLVAELPALLDRLQPLETVAIVVELHLLLFVGEDGICLVLASERDQSLRLTDPRVATCRPVVRVKRRLEREECPARLPLQEQDPAFFDRQLTVAPGLVAFEQVLDLRPQALGDHTEQANRRTRLAHLHLVQEGAAEVVAHDLGEAHATVLADPPDPLTQRLGLLDRPGVLVHVKGQFTGSREGRGCG